MKVLVSMNAFKGSLSAKEACSLVAQGFLCGYPEAVVSERPLADGGDGTVDVLLEALGGYPETVEVTGPYGDPVRARVGIVDGGKTVIIESASCSGLALVPPEKRDVYRAHSRGVGELLRWAALRGARRIIVGIGGTAMNDGGIGMAQAAGALIRDADGRDVPPGIPGLFSVASVALGSIPDTFRDIQVIGISDVSNPLVGPEGATAVYGPQKGINPSEIDAVDREMKRYAEILGRDLGRNPCDLPMAGAGGGLGGALWAFFGAKLVDGARFILEETGVLEEMDECDLVLTGEGTVDSQTKKGKVPFAVASAAAERSIPVIVIAGGLADDVIAEHPAEYSAMFSSTVRPMTVQSAMGVSRETLPFVAEQIARVARIFSLRFPSRSETSAGGVVVRRGPSGPELLLIEDRFGVFTLPKGHVDPGETEEQAAVREVLEETGIKACIKGEIGVTRYRFFDDLGRPVEKTVRYYLMEPLSENPRPQEGEVSKAFWADARQLSRYPTYPNNRAILEKAIRRVEELS
ncbi:MAG: glycerate kinase [Candidatus Fermentithermobacillus carboniphilus]|uniref:Glycerate kinase n=1 Tax=Candidatus Fermentithermobacillus carboniphilus TaxID=3085328 RepID=A0AAT9LAH4_9FIRM|nr:MAG: glycerate kinase [Candidatus Fermentithermobacillus carboniphilus]